MFITATTITATADDVCTHQFEDALPALDFLCDPKEEEFTVIFLDLNLKEMTGWQWIDLLRERREEGSCSRIPPIVILTSSINTEDKNRCEHYDEIIHFISKPFKPEDCEVVLSKLDRK
jgi:CheY-like chemotaxis protein